MTEGEPMACPLQRATRRAEGLRPLEGVRHGPTAHHRGGPDLCGPLQEIAPRFPFLDPERGRGAVHLFQLT